MQENDVCVYELNKDFLKYSKTGDIAEVVKKIFLDNRYIAIREVTEEVDISFGAYYLIFFGYFDMRRVSEKFVPKLLNIDQESRHISVSEELLNEVLLVKRIITGDETLCDLSEE